MAEQLTKAAFRAAVDTRFRIRVVPEQSVEVELIELREGRSSARQEQFALTFRGPADKFLGQGTFDMAHPSMGTFPLFLVPVAREPDGFRYEAVFNRLIEP